MALVEVCLRPQCWHEIAEATGVCVGQGVGLAWGDGPSLAPVMAYRKLPSYICKGRRGFVLQRAVPTDIRDVIGKAKFKESGGSTLNEARARAPGFVTRTDELIRAARGTSQLSNDDLIELLPELTESWGDVEDTIVGLQMQALDRSSGITPELLERAIKLLRGQSEPRKLFTAADLLQARYRDRQPAARTYEGWKKALEGFLAFTGKSAPLACTRQDAIDYRDHLLGRLSRNTAKVQLAYLAGLWTTLANKKQDEGAVNIFKGVAGTIVESTKAKALRASSQKRNKTFDCIPIDEWQPSKYLPVFKMLYYTGCRVSEIAGLRFEDIHPDYISVEYREDRSVKTEHSVRSIPIHPKLKQTIAELGTGTGHIWPALKTTALVDGIEVIRWGHNLAKPCRKITGLSPKDFRDRFVDQLRLHDFNQENIKRLTGHSPTDTNSTYGGKNWAKYVQMIEAIE